MSGNTEAGEASCVVRGNVGYYNSDWYLVEYNERSWLKFGRWLPDDVVITARVDRIINPIPLIVAMTRQLRSSEDENAFAEHGEVASYDMMKNDWLPPFGGGEVADINFSSRRTELGSEPYEYPSGIRTNVFYRYDVQIKFPGEGNGIVESLSSPEKGIRIRTAPESGYKPERVIWHGRLSRTDYKSSSDVNRCYCLRIRTELDENHRIKKAIYGKIYNDFNFITKKQGIRYVYFLYYLNPTPNDRNLEWDMKNNLCPKSNDIGCTMP